jgi:hypothetical protein
MTKIHVKVAAPRAENAVPRTYFWSRETPILKSLLHILKTKSLQLFQEQILETCGIDNGGKFTNQTNKKYI